MSLGVFWEYTVCVLVVEVCHLTPGINRQLSAKVQPTLPEMTV